MEGEADAVRVDVPDDGVASQVENPQVGHLFQDGHQLDAALVQFVVGQIERRQDGTVQQRPHRVGVGQLVRSDVQRRQFGQAL